MFVYHSPQSQREAATGVAAQWIIAASLGSLARAILFCVEGIDPARNGWVGHLALITPLSDESHEVAAAVAPVVAADPSRPADEYFDSLVLQDLFFQDDDDNYLSIHEVWSRLRDAQYAVETLVKYRSEWEAATERLIVNGVVTEGEARSFSGQWILPKQAPSGGSQPSKGEAPNASADLQQG